LFVKLELPVDQLTAWTTTVSRSLPAKPPVPVLAGLLLEATEDGDLTMSAFDFEVSTRTRGRVEVGEPGRALVSGRLLTEIARKLTKDATAQLHLDGVRLVLIAGSSRFTLPTLPVEEYPSLPQLEERSGTVDGELLAAAVAQVAIAAGRDDTLPVLTGVYAEVDLQQRQITETCARLVSDRVPLRSAHVREQRMVSPLQLAGSTRSRRSALGFRVHASELGVLARRRGDPGRNAVPALTRV
jgi:DNA polymerase III sliding clamp (beta) subunit (PCNA family)